ncbi:MAG: alpha/beta hydrolase [Rhodobacteraceae bacterium]|nr:alpha/beta hydrolase [Paracoccaceae bacterium]
MTWTIRQRSETGALAAIITGRGPKVLLLHGVGLRAEAWARQIDALAADGFHVTAPDMPGHGESPARHHLAGLTSYSDLVAACLDEPAVVVGHSMGAMIALDLAARYPEQVRGVVALNAVFRRSPAAKKAVAARLAALDRRMIPDPKATLTRWFGDTPSAERTACDEWLRAVDPIGYKAAYTVFANEDGPSAHALENLCIPAFFATGSAEQNSTPQMSRAMAMLAPQGRAWVVAGGGHMMPMTHATAVNRIVSGLIQECLP